MNIDDDEDDEDDGNNQGGGRGGRGNFGGMGPQQAGKKGAQARWGNRGGVDDDNGYGSNKKRRTI
jgi:hypothetical protein